MACSTSGNVEKADIPEGMSGREKVGCSPG